MNYLAQVIAELRENTLYLMRRTPPEALAAQVRMLLDGLDFKDTRITELEAHLDGAIDVLEAVDSHWFDPAIEDVECCGCDAAQEPGFPDAHDPRCHVQKAHAALTSDFIQRAVKRREMEQRVIEDAILWKMGRFGHPEFQDDLDASISALEALKTRDEEQFNDL